MRLDGKISTFKKWGLLVKILYHFRWFIPYFLGKGALRFVGVFCPTNRRRRCLLPLLHGRLGCSFMCSRPISSVVAPQYCQRICSGHNHIVILIEIGCANHFFFFLYCMSQADNFGHILFFLSWILDQSRETCGGNR